MQSLDCAPDAFEGGFEVDGFWEYLFIDHRSGWSVLSLNSSDDAAALQYLH
jgi:hypothetical protein